MGRDFSTTPSANPKVPRHPRLFLFNIPTCKCAVRIPDASTGPSNIPTFSFPYALPSSVSRNPFVCHSYENCRGVYQQFPFRNSNSCARQPALNKLGSWSRSALPLCALYVLCDLCVKSFFSFFDLQLSTLNFCSPHLFSFHTLPHSFAVSCIHEKLNPFLFMRFRTLRTRTRRVGARPLPTIPQLVVSCG